jgi:hypothetical protein
MDITLNLSGERAYPRGAQNIESIVFDAWKAETLVWRLVTSCKSKSGKSNIYTLVSGALVGTLLLPFAERPADEVVATFVRGLTEINTQRRLAAEKAAAEQARQEKAQAELNAKCALLGATEDELRERHAALFDDESESFDEDRYEKIHDAVYEEVDADNREFLMEKIREDLEWKNAEDTDERMPDAIAEDFEQWLAEQIQEKAKEATA